jgi:hypothetical protein
MQITREEKEKEEVNFPCLPSLSANTVFAKYKTYVKTELI